MELHHTNPMPNPIYHITSHDAWTEAAERGSYTSPSLETEGFIHCSDARQVERSLNKFYAGKDSVLVLRIDPELLTSELRYEPADNDSFPHVHGPINVDAVVAVELVERKGERFSYTPGE